MTWWYSRVYIVMVCSEWNAIFSLDFVSVVFFFKLIGWSNFHFLCFLFSFHIFNFISHTTKIRYITDTQFFLMCVNLVKPYKICNIIIVLYFYLITCSERVLRFEIHCFVIFLYWRHLHDSLCANRKPLFFLFILISFFHIKL